MSERCDNDKVGASAGIPRQCIGLIFPCVSMQPAALGVIVTVDTVCKCGMGLNILSSVRGGASAARSIICIFLKQSFVIKLM